MKKHMNNMNKKHVCFLMVGTQELPKIWKNLIFLREMFMFFSRVFIFFPVSCRSSLLWFRTVEGKLWIRAEHGHRFEVSYDWLLSYDASTCLNIMERSQI